jgi:vacuolar-type H+-ATPase subunit C/Vma6
MRVGRFDADILRECYTQSLVPPDALLAHVRAGTLKRYAPELAETHAQAVVAQTPERIGVICDRAYFARLLCIAEQSGDSFALTYARLLIDMYNLNVCARNVVHESFRARNALVSGGACELPTEFDPPALARQYARYGGVDRWLPALTEVVEAHNVSTLERVADDSTTEWVKHIAVQDFNLADLVRYFHAVKNNAQIISTIAKAKRAGMSEKDLRAILRALYA